MVNLEDKKPTTVAGQPTGDVTESGNPTHNADGTFGSNGTLKKIDKNNSNSFLDFIETLEISEEDAKLNDLDLDSMTEYKKIEEMTNTELAVEIKSHREFLSNHFDLSEFGVNAFNGDLKLQCSNFRQLKTLVEKYPFKGLKKPQLKMNNRLTSANARTCISRFSYIYFASFIDFNSKDFKTYDQVKNHCKENVAVNWSMPCSEENYANYSLTHEYGHLLTAELMNRVGDSFEDFEEFEKRVRRQIIQIYKEQTNYIGELNNNGISRYGCSSPAEFIAECFANLNCGKPNQLGKAMEIWLKKYGGY